MQGNTQQAYDRGITTFSPDGRLYQVEYAREAVKRGTATVGVRTSAGVALLTDKRAHSSLLEPSSVEKIYTIDDHVAVATAGHVADARHLVEFAREEAQRERLRYDEPIDVETLTKRVTDHIQEFTQTGGARPFGTALLVAGVTDGAPALYEADPGGTPQEWKATAVGGDQTAIRESLETGYDEPHSLDSGIDLGLRALAAATDEPLTADRTGIATIDTESERLRLFDHGERSARLDTTDLTDEDSRER